MAETGRLSQPAVAPSGLRLDPVLALRLLIVAVVLAAWELLAASGLLYKDVVPSLVHIATALYTLLSTSNFYQHLGITATEVGIGLAIGGLSGLVVGLVLGGSRFMSRAYEPYLYYLAPAPKIIFFPVMIMWFGVGSGSKIAMGVLSCFFPIVISTAAGMREVDAVLIRVGRSFRLTAWQMATKIYLPALRQPIINGVRLGLGVAIPLAFFQPGGGWKLLGLVLLVKIIVQCVESWFLTPRIMGHSTGLHPVAIIVAIFFWGTAFGVRMSADSRTPACCAISATRAALKPSARNTSMATSSKALRVG